MNKKIKQKIAVITGANRGLGLETATQLYDKGYFIVFAIRDLKASKEILAKLDPTSDRTKALELDVGNNLSVVKFVEHVVQEFDHLDVLVNNAGVLFNDPPSKIKYQDLQTSFDVNLIGPWMLTQLLLPLLLKSDSGRIINVSSGAGQTSRLFSHISSYSISKLALNGFTRVLADELSETKIAVNAVGPGWVKTRMGGPSASLSVEDGVDSIVWLATTSNSPKGKFIRDRKVENW